MVELRGHRKIQDLEEVTLGRSPFGEAKLTGAALRGKRYEKAGIKALKVRFPQGMANPWFKFKDAFGGGMASPDFLIVEDHFVTIVEFKLTWKPQAHDQISELYSPLCEEFFQRPAGGVVVVRNLVPGVPTDWIRPKVSREAGFCNVVHWLGRGEI